MNYMPFVSWGLLTGGTALQRAAYFSSWGLLGLLPINKNVILIGSVWKSITDIFVLVANAWKSVTETKICRNGAWK